MASIHVDVYPSALNLLWRIYCAIYKTLVYLFGQDTNEINCLRLFLGYHGLPLLWSWMADIGKGDLEEDSMLKMQVSIQT
jgi:hypothetical protein